MTRRALLALAFVPFWPTQEPPTPQGELTELRNRLFSIEERLGMLEHPQDMRYKSNRTLKT